MKRIILTVFSIAILASIAIGQIATDIKLTLFDPADSTWKTAAGRPVESAPWGRGIIARMWTDNGTTWTPLGPVGDSTRLTSTSIVNQLFAAIDDSGRGAWTSYIEIDSFKMISGKLSGGLSIGSAPVITCSFSPGGGAPVIETSTLTSVYGSLVLCGGDDGWGRGALYAVSMRDTSVEPFAGVCGYDCNYDGIREKQVYIGGVGWQAPNANSVVIWSTQTYAGDPDGLDGQLGAYLMPGGSWLFKSLGVGDFNSSYSGLYNPVAYKVYVEGGLSVDKINTSDSITGFDGSETISNFGAYSTKDTLSPFVVGDPNTNGSWRLIGSGDDLVVQRKESDVWVTKQTYSP